ncbi:MAG TPA: DUF21 domain-containing protein, partial [Bacteroidales bacterium]|nr:DUF21 domain-containing protein [Bacteroidales bacterium]
METLDPFQYHFALFCISITTPVIIELAVLIVLLACSAFVSGSEVAFFSLGPTEIDKLAVKDSRNATTALKLLSSPEELLSTILVANNFINVGIVLLSAYISDQL